MSQFNVDWTAKVLGKNGHIILSVTSEGCSNLSVHTQEGQSVFQPVTFWVTIDLFAFFPSLTNSQRRTVQVQLVLTGWSMRTDNDLTLVPMSIRECLEPKVNCCSWLNCTHPWVRCLAHLTQVLGLLGRWLTRKGKLIIQGMKTHFKEETNPSGSSYGS